MLLSSAANFTLFYLELKPVGVVLLASIPFFFFSLGNITCDMIFFFLPATTTIDFCFVRSRSMSANSPRDRSHESSLRTVFLVTAERFARLVFLRAGLRSSEDDDELLELEEEQAIPCLRYSGYASSDELSLESESDSLLELLCMGGRI